VTKPGQRRGGQSERILLCEDEEGIRHTTRRILEAEGYAVLVAGSAEEAIEAAGGHSSEIQLLITDLSLPGMGGSELAGVLRSTRPRIRVLYVSGSGPDATPAVDDAREGFLGKPHGPDALLEAVREILDRDEAGPAQAD